MIHLVEHGCCLAVVLRLPGIVEDLGLVVMIDKMIEKRAAVLGLKRWPPRANTVKKPTPCLKKLADHHQDLCSP